MAIPLSTTLVTITRPTFPSTSPSPDPYDSTPTLTVIASGVRATIAPPTSATVRLVGGDRDVYNSKLICDPTPVAVDDTVTDTVTGNVWTVLWVQASPQLGLSHTIAGIRLVTGAV
jgi:hypothetical protein